MKKIPIAIDLGTTNTVVALWNDSTDGPEILHLDSVCRNSVEKSGEIDDSYTIPSCVYLLSPGERFSFPFNLLFKNLKVKTGGLIGIKAIEKNGGLYRPWYVNNFKSYLGKNIYQFIGQLGRWKYTAEDIALIFLKELLLEMKKTKKVKPDRLTFCVPVDFYEFYRAKLKRICARLRIYRIKTIDEPVAAALGYGLGMDGLRNILVIDFGAGTLDLAIISTMEKSGDSGTCTVVAKDGASIGGNLVDSWIVQDVCRHFSYDFERLSTDQDIRWWYRMLLAEACRIKENLFTREADSFFLMPSKLMDEYAHTVPGDRENLKRPLEYTREDLKGLLKKKGLYTMLDGLIRSVIETAEAKGTGADRIDDVLMVGGSTLLPDIYPLVEKRFGRDRVRAWQPFNAVAFGAAAFAANRYGRADYITHDYAFVTYDKKTLEPEYNVIVPHGTPFPTQKDFWKRHLSPTCALGEPERMFKLVICEIGKKQEFEQEFVWDEKGNMHIVKEGDNNRVIIQLNESDPTLGYLDPPHAPSDKRARVEISFMINDEKWLCATVYDLVARKYLMEEKPVIRLK